VAYTRDVKFHFGMGAKSVSEREKWRSGPEAASCWGLCPSPLKENEKRDAVETVGGTAEKEEDFKSQARRSCLRHVREERKKEEIGGKREGAEVRKHSQRSANVSMRVWRNPP